MTTTPVEERIREIYSLLLAYQGGSREVLGMPWTAKRLELAQAELDALRAGDVARADDLAAETEIHLAAMSNDSNAISRAIGWAVWFRKPQAVVDFLWARYTGVSSDSTMSGLASHPCCE